MVTHIVRLVRQRSEAILRSLEAAADDQALLCECDCDDLQPCGC